MVIREKKDNQNGLSGISRGFTLIEAMVTLFIFSLITLVFYEAFSTGTRMIIEVKNRFGAVALANEKMEIIRSLDYGAIGTKRPSGDGYVYGIPPGDILENETVSANTRSYTVHTFVQYVDDDFDGRIVGTDVVDTVPTDYKRVRVEVSWGSEVSQSVALVALFAPPGVETDEGGGTLAINVIDGSGSGIGQASVHIVNTSVSPSIDMTAQTDASGNLMLPGAPASSQGYRLSVSKLSHYPVRTYGPYPTESFHPVDMHASVVSGNLNQKTVIIDRSVDFMIRVKDPAGNDISVDTSANVRGGRILGNEAVSPFRSVYSLFEDVVIDASGGKLWEDVSPGEYVFSLVDDTDWMFLGLSAQETVRERFTLLPGENRTITATLADRRTPSLLVRVSDQSFGSWIQNAAVRLTSSSSGYDTTVMTDAYGQAYFPDSSQALISGATYEAEVTAPGFTVYSDTVTIGSGLDTLDVVLND